MSRLIDRPPRGMRVGALAAAALAAALWWSGTLAAPEIMLERGYRMAIADAEAYSAGIRLTPAALHEATQSKPVAAIWPGPSPAQSLAFHRPLKVGDRITISSREGKADKLSVVELQQIDGAGIGAPGLQFQLVTSRQDGPADGSLVRFLIAIDGATVAPAADKTL